MVGVVATASLELSCAGNAPVMADPSPPTELPAAMFFEPCNNYTTTSDFLPGDEVLYAEHEFSGMKAADIVARVHILGDPNIHFPGYVQGNTTGDGFRHPSAQMLVRDGSAAVVCGFVGEPLNFDTVTFVFR